MEVFWMELAAFLGFLIIQEATSSKQCLNSAVKSESEISSDWLRRPLIVNDEPLDVKHFNSAFENWQNTILEVKTPFVDLKSQNYLSGMCTVNINILTFFLDLRIVWDFAFFKVDIQYTPIVKNKILGFETDFKDSGPRIESLGYTVYRSPKSYKKPVEGWITFQESKLKIGPFLSVTNVGNTTF